VAIGRHRSSFRAYLRSHRCQNGSTQTGFLDAIHGRGFSRKVGSDGIVDVDDEHYYLQQSLAGQRVVLLVSAPDRTFEVWLAGRLIKSLPIKGLVGQEMTWQKYVAFMTEQARSEERRLLDKQHRLRQRSLGT
jgi:hypothetical protein